MKTKSILACMMALSCIVLTTACQSNSKWGKAGYDIPIIDLNEDIELHNC